MDERPNIELERGQQSYSIYWLRDFNILDIQRGPAWKEHEGSHGKTCVCKNYLKGLRERLLCIGHLQDVIGEIK